MNKNNNIDYNILFRYFEQNATLEEQHLVREWEQNPDTMAEIEEAYHIWHNHSKDELILKENELEVLFNRNTKKYKKHLLKKSLVYYYTITLCLLSTLFIFNHYQRHDEVLYIVKTMNNTMGNTEVWLSDSTHVILSKGSILKLWDIQADKNYRAVQLRGKAFFDVAKNKDTPFVIETGTEMLVKVLGTSFVLNTDSTDFDLGLITGRVELVENDKLENVYKVGIVIQPGQMVHYKTLLNEYAITIDSFFNTSVAMNWTNPKLNLQLVSLGNVLDNLSAWYNVNMECNPTLREKYICTIQISDETLSQTLDILSLMMPLKITQNGDKIQIQEK